MREKRVRREGDSNAEAEKSVPPKTFDGDERHYSSYCCGSRPVGRLQKGCPDRSDRWARHGMTTVPRRSEGLKASSVILVLEKRKMRLRWRAVSFSFLHSRMDVEHSQ